MFRRTEDHYPEEPCSVTILNKYSCDNCGLLFTEQDTIDNVECELDVDDNWRVTHVKCPDEDE